MLLPLMRTETGPSKLTLSVEEWHEGGLTLEELGHTEAVLQADRLMKC